VRQAGTEALSPAAVEAFRHQVAATTNIADIAMEWHTLGCLVDASLHADPSATAALRQQLNVVRLGCAFATTHARRPSI
jgi:hypothetical protein